MTPFPQWVVSGVSGVQLAHFTAPACAPVSRATGHRNTCACDAPATRAAKAALRAFDVVGLTSCLGGFFDELEAALQLRPADGRAARLLRRASKGNVSAGLLHAKPKCFDCSAAEARAHARWSWDALDGAAQRATLAAATCDGALYQMARARARLGECTLPPPRGEWR